MDECGHSTIDHAHAALNRCVFSALKPSAAQGRLIDKGGQENEKDSLTNKKRAVLNSTALYYFPAK